MSVKEKDLPVAGALTGSDYVRVVSAGGSSEIIPYSGFESDPIFMASPAYGITATNKTNWTNAYNGKISLDTTASPGTTDGDLYAAIVALGWDSDVIE